MKGNLKCESRRLLKTNRTKEKETLEERRETVNGITINVEHNSDFSSLRKNVILSPIVVLTK